MHIICLHNIRNKILQEKYLKRRVEEKHPLYNKSQSASEKIPSKEKVPSAGGLYYQRQEARKKKECGISNLNKWLKF